MKNYRRNLLLIAIFYEVANPDKKFIFLFSCLYYFPTHGIE